MKTIATQRTLLAALAVGGAFTVAPAALASNPLEYPDNGAASFSRGGAWLATANEPIATHYNPAALATQGSGFSIDQNLSFNHVCYDRRGPDGKEETTAEGLQYQPACNERSGFPSAVPSIAIAWRATAKLGIGVAIVPPSTYVISDNTFSDTKIGLKTDSNPPTYQQMPAPWRYQLLQQRSTILFPTLGIGYEIAKNFRIGAGFISGIATINTTVAGVAVESAPPMGQVGPNVDTVQQDGFTTLKTKDLFVPGAILAIHWSPVPVLDVAAWGRYISPVESTKGEVTLTKNAYQQFVGADGSPPYSQPSPICRQGAACANNPNVGVPYQFGNETFRKFKLPIPPEIRVGVRYHQPRSGTPKLPNAGITDAMPKRDPLHDDLFDVELDGSYTFNESANTIEIRFAELAGHGTGVVPPGYVPPNADRWNGFKNSYGVRLGGQYNVLQDKLGIRAGAWVETKSQDAQWLQVSYVAPLRGGFGGGVVFRQNFIDISIGFQHHWSAGLDNHGNGLMTATTTAGNDARGRAPNLNLEPSGVTAATRQQYRTYHAINDGRITQSANVFTLGATVHF